MALVTLPLLSLDRVSLHVSAAQGVPLSEPLAPLPVGPGLPPLPQCGPIEKALLVALITGNNGMNLSYSRSTVKMREFDELG